MFMPHTLPAECPPDRDASAFAVNDGADSYGFDTMPMLYRSEAFAEDLLDDGC